MITKKRINLKIDWGTDAEEFNYFVGRYPHDLEELNKWADCLRKGIDEQVDWDIIGECASQEFEK
jgi:hypothetical protein